MKLDELWEDWLTDWRARNPENEPYLPLGRCSFCQGPLAVGPKAGLTMCIDPECSHSKAGAETAPEPPKFFNVAEMIGTSGLQAIALPEGMRKMFEEAAEQAQLHVQELAVYGETVLRVPPAAVPMDGMPQPSAPMEVSTAAEIDAADGTAAKLLELYTALPASALDAEPGEWPLVSPSGMEYRNVAGEWEAPGGDDRPVLVAVTWDEQDAEGKGFSTRNMPNAPAPLREREPEPEPSFSDFTEPWEDGTEPVFTMFSHVQRADLCPNPPQSTPFHQAVAAAQRVVADLRERLGWPTDPNPMSRVEHHYATAPVTGQMIPPPGRVGGVNTHLHGVETPRSLPTYVYVASSWRNEMQPAVVAVLRAAGIDCYDFRDPHGDGAGGFSWKDVRDEEPVRLCQCGATEGAHLGAELWDDGLCPGFRPVITAKGSDWVPADEYLRMIEHPAALEGFAKDLAAMERADVFVLVLPCGKSAHLEAGWAMGAGKRVVILLEDPVEPELMYRTTYESGGTIVTDTMGLLAALGVED